MEVEMHGLGGKFAVMLSDSRSLMVAKKSVIVGFKNVIREG